MTVESEQAKRLLLAIAEALPEHGPSHVRSIEFRHGWGDILNVRLHTPLAPTPEGRSIAAQLKAAVSDVLADQRHAVEIVWNHGI